MDPEKSDRTTEANDSRQGEVSGVESASCSQTIKALLRPETTNFWLLLSRMILRAPDRTGVCLML